MDDGVLRVSLKEGKAHKIEVGTGLEQTYAELFEKARKQARSRQSREVGIKVVLFGCFWLEALCNTCLRQILERTTLPESVQITLANVVERTRISAKLQILSAFRPPAHTELLKRANALFDLRNRLVHFRETFEEVQGPVALDTIERNVFGQLQETELVKLLKPPALDASIKDILQTKQWLSRVRGVRRARKR